MNFTIEYILNNVIFACAKGTSLTTSERQSLEGVHAVLCAKEIFEMIKNKNITLTIFERHIFEKSWLITP